MQPKENADIVVAVRRIYLSSIQFNDGENWPQTGEVDINFLINGAVSVDRKNGRVKISIGLVPQANKDCQLKVEMVGEFEQKGETPIDWEKFNQLNGPAIVFPYVRELISNLTVRIGRPVILPPMNLTKFTRVEQEKK